MQQGLVRHSEIRTTMNLYGDAVTNEMAQSHPKGMGLALGWPAQTDCDGDCRLP